jgi:hypothetical protein
MRSEDKNIGIVVYGWTLEETEKNNWYDEFFDVWRPKPRTQEMLYPAWSSSSKFALDLIDYLVRRSCEITIGFTDDDRVFVTVEHPMFSGVGKAHRLPQAVAACFRNIERPYIQHAGAYKTIHQALKGT